jgi:enhancing lycopene biosynthesis protein 2
MERKRIGVLLSGCGVQDGSEIHEAVLTLAALDKAGAEAVCMAPDRDQHDVVDHLTGKTLMEKRNMLAESARIARGEIRSVAEVDADELDGIVLPGGFGAVKNLSSFAREGAECTVDPDVARLLEDIHNAGKPIAALCIAPAVLAALFGEKLAPEITIGTDEGTAEALETMGAKHRSVNVTDVVVDRENRMVTTPCYMSASRISEIADGTKNAVRELLVLVEESRSASV